MRSLYAVEDDIAFAQQQWGEVTAVVQTVFGADISGTEESKVLGDMRGVISAKTEREENARHGILGPQFDVDEEEQRIAEEQQRRKKRLIPSPGYRLRKSR